MHDIIQITGNVKFQITLDPTIWIFDERRFEISDKFSDVHGLAIPIAPFLNNAEPTPSATKAIFHCRDKETTELKLDQVTTGYLCFAKDGKPIREGGPALFYLADGSNKLKPINSIQMLELV